MYEDNVATIQILNDECKATSNTKHMQVKFLVAREAIKEKEIRLEYVATDRQLADALTKAPTGRMLETYREGIGMVQTQNIPHEEGC
jgi:hypothetical protein